MGQSSDRGKTTYYCRKCLRKLSRKHPKRHAFAKDFIQRLGDEPGRKICPRGCLDKCPKKGLMLKCGSEKITLKPVPELRV